MALVNEWKYNRDFSHIMFSVTANGRSQSQERHIILSIIMS